MNFHTKLSALVISLCFIIPVSTVTAEEVTVTNVIDAGTDGDERFYTVYCSDGTRASLVKRYTIGEVCTQPSYADKDICSKWTVDEAAIEACK